MEGKSMEKKTRQRALHHFLVSAENARKRCPHTCVLYSLVMRTVSCDSVQPGATLHSAAPQLAANSKWGSGSFAHCGEVDVKFSFSDLEKFKKKNQQA